MIKLYYRTAMHLFAYMLFLKRNVKHDIGYVLENLRDDGALSDPEQSLIYKLRKSYDAGESKEELSDILSLLEKQICYFDPASKERTLIDAIVSALQLPFAKGVLSGKALEKLKKAILLPDEIASFAAILEAKEQTCASCARALHDHELTTFVRGEGMFCFRCLNPRYAACSRCEDGVVEVGASFEKLRKGSCKNHGVQATDEPRIDNRPAPTPIGRGIPRGFAAIPPARRYPMTPPPRRQEADGQIFIVNNPTGPVDPLWTQINLTPEEEG